MRVMQFLLMLSLSTVSITTFASQQETSYNGPVAFGIATATMGAMGVASWNFAPISAGAVHRKGAIGLGTLATFVASVIWETAAKKIARDDETPYRFSQVAGKFRDAVVKPYWENAGYGFAMYYDMFTSLFTEAVTVGKDYADTFVLTPVESVRKGIDQYCKEHDLDKRAAYLGAILLTAASATIPGVVAYVR